jgi:hypothetical protein
VKLFRDRAEYYAVKNASQKSSFHVMIAPLAPTLPSLGRGRIAMLQYYLNGKFPGNWHSGNTAQSQSGDAIAAGACLHAKKSVRIIQRISQEL